MILAIEYDMEEQLTSEHKPERRKKYIECDDIIYSETADEWHVMCYLCGKSVCDVSFPLGNELSATGYLMENGKTVDRLPRR